jgi:hypothetical protein
MILITMNIHYSEVYIRIKESLVALWKCQIVEDGGQELICCNLRSTEYVPNIWGGPRTDRDSALTNVLQTAT